MYVYIAVLQQYAVVCDIYDGVLCIKTVLIYACIVLQGSISSIGCVGSRAYRGTIGSGTACVAATVCTVGVP